MSGQILHVLQGHVLAEYIRDLHYADEKVLLPSSSVTPLEAFEC